MVSDKDGLAGGTLAETLLQNREPVMNYAVAVGRAHQNQNAWRGNLTRAGSTAGVVVAFDMRHPLSAWLGSLFLVGSDGSVFCVVVFRTVCRTFGLLPRREQIDRDKRPMA